MILIFHQTENSNVLLNWDKLFRLSIENNSNLWVSFRWINDPETMQRNSLYSVCSSQASCPCSSASHSLGFGRHTSSACLRTLPPVSLYPSTQIWLCFQGHQIFTMPQQVVFFCFFSFCILSFNQCSGGTSCYPWQPSWCFPLTTQ